MDATDILEAHNAGDPNAASRLAPQLYDELRALARRQMLRERRQHTLQPTALVHEVYLRLIDQSRVSVQGKAHFMALAAREMRRVLVEWARAHKAQKRGGGMPAVTLDDRDAVDVGISVDILALDEALRNLAALDERTARVVELLFLSGMTATEAGEVLGVSERTVREEWKFGRSWLARQLRTRS